MTARKLNPKPRNEAYRTCDMFSNRSVLVPVRMAKPGEPATLNIGGRGYVRCPMDEREMMTKIPRSQLNENQVI